MTDPTLTQLITEAAELFQMPDPQDQRLLEFTSNPGDQFTTTTTTTSSTDDDGALYIEGVFIAATSKSDIRFTSSEDMHRAVRDYQKQFVATGQALGELRSVDWKPKPIPDPANAALRVVDLSIEPNGDVKGKAVLISRSKLRALVAAGWCPVIRVRALGRQDRNGVIQPGWKLMAFDVAWSSDSKSTLNAFGRPVNESLNEQQQQEPAQPAAPATPSADKPRLIRPELLAEKFNEKRQANSRMKQWIESCRNNTKF
ncbi:hypothetical protein I6M49_04325 [Shewanella algae]|uniref:hypothetical protein n=1 Tax=Shewanella algae TaxID=38313 RepID=UPI001AAD3864|nr:hypothetical protein [Shewanella algae]MBO2652699.1 hypothetical protein [Shewanella algae]